MSHEEIEEQEQYQIPEEIKIMIQEFDLMIPELEEYKGKSNFRSEIGSVHDKPGLYMGQVTTDDIKQGKGTLIIQGDEENPESIKYFEGYFDNDLFNGPGFLIQSFNRILEGEWKEGRMVGMGRIRDLDGNFYYEGELENGLPHGEGIIEYGSGYSYVGNFRYFMKHGEGELRYSNGDFFKGNFVNNMKNGFGIMKWKDGRSFRGYYRNDKIHGRGYYRWKDGSNFNGSYSKGEKDGYGVFSLANGSRYEGYFKNGKQNGKGIIITKDGLSTKGFWDHGRRVGAKDFESSVEEKKINTNNKFKQIQQENKENEQVSFNSGMRENGDCLDPGVKLEESELDGSDSMRFADHFSECDERQPITSEDKKASAPVIGNSGGDMEPEMEEPEVIDSMDFADEFSECNERTYVPDIAYYQQEEENEEDYGEVNTGSEPSIGSNSEVIANYQVQDGISQPSVMEEDEQQDEAERLRLSNYKVNNLHEEVQEKKDMEELERCSRRIPDEGNIKIPKIITRNLKPMVSNSSELLEFQGFTIPQQREPVDKIKSGLTSSKVIEYNPERKDHQPFFFERVKKFFSFSINDKYLIVLKEWTVMKIDIQNKLIIDEIEFRQHSDNYYDNNPLPEPTNIYYSKSNNDLVIFFQEYRKMDYKMIDLDDMTRSVSKKFTFGKSTQTEIYLNKIYEEGKFEIRYIPNNFEVKDEIFFKIFKSVDTDSSEQTVEDEAVHPPVLIGLDYHKGTCRTLNRLCPYSENMINYPFVFPELGRVVNLNFSIETYEWKLILKDLETEKVLIERVIGFSLDDMLSCLVDLGDSKFYSIDRAKSYLFEDRYFMFFVETDLFEYRIKPWLWDLDKEEIGISLFVDLKTGKNRYKETRFDKTNDRRCTIGVFRQEEVEDLVFNLPQKVEDNNWIRYEQWQKFVQIYKIYEYDRYRGGYLSSKVVNSALENKPMILIEEKTTTVKFHCHSVFKYDKSQDGIERLTDIEFINYYAREQEDKLEFSEKFIIENEEKDGDSIEEMEIMSRNGIIHWENDNIHIDGAV